MSRYLKLIWFAEDPWTKYHAAIGINAQKTLCGVYRSSRAILPSEKLGYPDSDTAHYRKCSKCLAALKNREWPVGTRFKNGVVEVKVE